MMMDSLRMFLQKGVLITAVLLLFGCASFELTSQPQADIYENGEMIGRTPHSFTIVSGFRSFTLKRFGYVDQEVMVSSLGPRRQHFNLEWVGQTRVESKPPGAKVVRLEDNAVVGVTPCRLYLARPVDVVFRLEGFEELKGQLVPNRLNSVELHSVHGYKPAYYREIYFTSRQGAVEVYDRVAGERIGITPVKLTVEVGNELEYRLRDHVSDYAVISRNAPSLIDIRLEPVERVTLSGPPGASVFRAGESTCLGQVPVVVEVSGPQLYEVKKQGYHDRTVAIAPGSPPRVDAELERIPCKTIVSDPPGAEVYRLGGLEKLGTTPFTTVVEGECVFELRKEGCKPCMIGIGPSSPEQLSVTLSALSREDPDAAAVGELDRAALDVF